MSTNGDKSKKIPVVSGITGILANSKELEVKTQDSGEIESPLSGLVIEVKTFTATKGKDGKIVRKDNETGKVLSGKTKENAIERD